MTEVEDSENSKSRSRRRTRSIKNSLRKTRRTPDSQISRFNFVEDERENVPPEIVTGKSGKRSKRKTTTSKKMRGDVSRHRGKSQRKKKRGRVGSKSGRKTPNMSKFEKSSRRRKQRMAAIEKKITETTPAKPDVSLVRHNFKSKELDMGIFQTEDIAKIGKENVERNLLEIFYTTDNISEENEQPQNWANVQYCSKMSKESLQKLQRSKIRDHERHLISDNFDTFNANGNNYVKAGDVLKDRSMNINQIEIQEAENLVDESTKLNSFVNNNAVYKITDSSEQSELDVKQRCDEEVEKSLQILKSMTKNFQDENQIMSYLKQTFSDKFEGASLSEYEQQIQSIVDNRRRQLSNLKNLSEDANYDFGSRKSRKSSKRKNKRKYSSHKFSSRRKKENLIKVRRRRKANSGSRKKGRSLSNNSKHSSGDVVGKVQRFQC